MASVTTSIIVQFSGSESGTLTAEIDGREDGLNAGKTTFAPGDVAKFLVFKSDDVIIDSIVSSCGTVTPDKDGLFAVEEWLTFLNTTEANPSKRVYSGFTYEWYGNDLGAVTVKGGKIVCATKGVGCLKVKYNAHYQAYSLPSPATLNGKTSFQIAVLVKGHN